MLVYGCDSSALAAVAREIWSIKDVCSVHEHIAYRVSYSFCGVENLLWLCEDNRVEVAVLILFLVSYSSHTDGPAMRERCGRVTVLNRPSMALWSSSPWPDVSRDHNQFHVV
ncbi:hypothetical protein KC19_8G182500 [Ceratodon purpureus]|uniref:Uncharacterized protein n=1 Tax=Ceratodon purpureus TaxID=3225 RepID=A0A8T0H1W6_CERPU|nr:hypothetical protein KC19_8G182500 [Ceratodon purpureus]